MSFLTSLKNFFKTETTRRHTYWQKRNFCHCGWDTDKKYSDDTCPKCGCEGSFTSQKGRWEWDQVGNSFDAYLDGRQNRVWVLWTECADFENK